MQCRGSDQQSTEGGEVILSTPRAARVDTGQFICTWLLCVPSHVSHNQTSGAGAR